MLFAPPVPLSAKPSESPALPDGPCALAGAMFPSLLGLLLQAVASRSHAPPGTAEAPCARTHSREGAGAEDDLLGSSAEDGSRSPSPAVLSQPCPLVPPDAEDRAGSSAPDSLADGRREPRADGPADGSAAEGEPAVAAARAAILADVFPVSTAALLLPASARPDLARSQQPLRDPLSGQHPLPPWLQLVESPALHIASAIRAQGLPEPPGLQVADPPTLPSAQPLGRGVAVGSAGQVADAPVFSVGLEPFSSAPDFSVLAGAEKELLSADAPEPLSPPAPAAPASSEAAPGQKPASVTPHRLEGEHAILASDRLSERLGKREEAGGSASHAGTSVPRERGDSEALRARPRGRTEAQPVSALQAATNAPVVHHGHLSAGDARPAPRGRAHLPELVERAQAELRILVREARTEARISLRPPELGEVRIRVAFDAGGVSATLTADASQAVEVLAGAVSDLRRSLESLGLAVLSLDVRSAGLEQRPAEERRGETAPDGMPTSRRSTADDEEGNAPRKHRLPLEGALIDVLA